MLRFQKTILFEQNAFIRGKLHSEAWRGKYTLNIIDVPAIFSAFLSFLLETFSSVSIS